MRFTATPIDGVLVVDLETRGDDRGFFARAFCADEFSEHGLVADVAQANLAYNVHAGTTRGLHYTRRRGTRGEVLPLHSRRDVPRRGRHTRGIADPV